MSDPYRTPPAMPVIAMGQRWLDPLGRAFVVTGRCTTPDGSDRWLADHEGGKAIWLEDSDVLQCSREGWP
jgi:hypothetical protein